MTLKDHAANVNNYQQENKTVECNDKRCFTFEIIIILFLNCIIIIIIIIIMLTCLLKKMTRNTTITTMKQKEVGIIPIDFTFIWCLNDLDFAVGRL